MSDDFKLVDDGAYITTAPHIEPCENIDIPAPELSITDNQIMSSEFQECISEEPNYPVEVIMTSNIEKDYSPKIKIWGLGGFGVNQICNLPNILNYSNSSYCIIDTSTANTHRQNIDNKINVIYVGNDGHGKLRGTNLDVLQQKVDNIVYTDEDESDIDIVVFSLSGGSGSVVGPLVVKSLARKDKPIIIVTVADSTSTVDCENSIKTIKSIENIARNNYVNMILFDNSIDGRETVDQSIVNKLIKLTTAINLNYIRELDKSDIIVAMRPYHHKILSEVRGLYVMRIDDGCHYSYDDEEIMSCHSSILVGVPDQYLKQKINRLHTSIHYEGKFVNYMEPIFINFGLPISETFIKKYDSVLKRAQAASSVRNVQSTIKIKDVDEHDSGLII